MKKHGAKDVSSYIRLYPKEAQILMKAIRATIQKNAPNAEERISYGICAYFMDGPLVYFGAFSKHVGFYPGAAGITQFKKDLAKYKMGRGSVQIPLGSKPPLARIAKIVRFRVAQNKLRALKRKK